MTRPDLAPALDWLSVVADAVAAGRPWQADSDRHIRAQPTGGQVAPRLYAVVLARWTACGLTPDQAVTAMRELLTAAAAAWPDPDTDPPPHVW